MKKIAIFICMFLLLAGCSAKNSSQYIGQTDDITDSSTSEDNSISESDEYEKYDILSYEYLGENKWKITNNWDDIIPHCNISVGFYDADDTLVDVMLCGTDAALPSGKSAIVSTVTEEEYSYCDVVAYYYEPPEKYYDTLGAQITVDVLSKEITVY